APCPPRTAWTPGRRDREARSSVPSLPPQQHGAGRNALAAGDETALRVHHLRSRGPAHLAHALEHEAEAVHVRLRHAAAGGVGRKPAVGPLERAVLGERRTLAALAEAVALERERDQRAERVVDLRDVDVGGLDVAVGPQPFRGGPG